MGAGFNGGPSPFVVHEPAMSGDSCPGGALFSFARVPELSPSLMDFDLFRMPFFGLIVLRFEESAWGSEESLELPEPVRNTSERLSVAVSDTLFVWATVAIPSELGVRTGRPRSGVEAPLRPLEYRLGECCCSGSCRIEFPWLLRRDDDLLALKLEKMLLESLRGFGEAGDCGML